MKRIVLLLTLFLVVGAVFFFDLCGGAIRDFLSPKVYWAVVEYERYDGVMCMKLPKEAVFRNPDGETCVYAIESVEKYAETCMVVREIVVEAAETDEAVYIAMRYLGSANRVVARSSEPLTDGVQVKVLGNA